jgi:hypothetical protein
MGSVAKLRFLAATQPRSLRVTPCLWTVAQAPGLSESATRVEYERFGLRPNGL